MSKLIGALLTVATVGIGCAPSVHLKLHDLESLRASSGVPIAHRVSPTPVVDCPGDWGEQTWSGSGGSLGMEWPPPSTLLLAEYTPAARPVRLAGLAGSLWEQVQDQRTESLRKAPPRDPARATEAGFLSLSLGASPAVPFRDNTAPLESVDRRALAKRFGESTVLVFETTRSVLVGCFYTYEPWFNVRATLIDVGSGKVLWRETCGGLYPPDPFAEASPAELEANGKALYSSMLDARAERCARDLFKSFVATTGGGPAG
jgi:hypothetical protein